MSDLLGLGGALPSRRVSAPPEAYVTIAARDATLNLSVTALIGPTTVTPRGGGGGWKAVPRPKRRPIVVWEGPTDAYALSLDLIFDGAAEGRSVEAELRTLDAMAGVNQHGDPEPPVLIVDAGGALPYDKVRYPRGLWVIPDTPQLGESTRRSFDRDRIQATVTVTLMLWTPGDGLRRTTFTAPARSIVAQGGDTYTKIAARTLTQFGGWALGNRLAQFNGERDGASKIPAGTTVKLPSADEVKTWATSPRRVQSTKPIQSTPQL